jgi:hypothetical protein
MGVAPDGSPVAIYQRSLARERRSSSLNLPIALEDHQTPLSRGERVVELLDGRRDAGLDARFR